MSDLSVASEASHKARVDETAHAIYAFLKEVMSDADEANVYFDREKTLLILEAFKSRSFMRLIEEDEDLPYDLKVNVSQMVSGLSKTWPTIRKLMYDKASSRFAFVGWKMAKVAATILDTLGIQVVMETEAEEMTPTELPPE